ncbi:MULTISPECIES: protein translocase subunit SecD [Streptomyces]|uniref:Protein translocase subunit SecD n=4 Tax=Streptomyces TaxID=1883 RepID=A0A380NB06_STRGR|nr:MULTISPECIES: protein translocase subunit SecD [Streptomyces]NEE42139.1 protein translocase subunit SecD [Streptomyces sp. SID7982]NEE55655.1 protein translocase subunit SecD [Streptomyces sp. SID8455]PJM82367.1 protein translocase subunit SecD [Streptomyces sp. TSRI0384-2]QNE80308.1 protein translocase subunit SecD [Streptomyces rutgersensis]WPR50327.1 protein translocase subunit SecD [Streptomyces sp. S399]
MASPKKGRKQPGQGRPGRALALILIVLVALTGGMFLSGHSTPRLGIDLAGGTSITLQARSEPGQESAVNQTNMNTAVGIIERRVNGLGVSEAEVQTQGNDHIIVNIPKGTNEKQAREQVGTTAQLYFRPVLQLASGEPAPEGSATPSASGSPDEAEKGDGGEAGGDKATEGGDEATDGGSGEPEATPTTQGRAASGALKADATPSPSGPAEDDADPTPSPSASAAEPSEALQKKFEALTCTDTEERTEASEGTKPAEPIVACGTNAQGQWEKYILGPSAVAGTEVDDATAAIDQQGAQGWLVNMEFTDKGKKQFADVTSDISAKPSPQNQFAIVLDGDVVSAPYVREPLTGGTAQISGSFTQESAQDLANMLSYGALPLSFVEESVTSVTAALGGEQLEAGLIAGAIGLLLVVVYLVVYYRGLSLIAIISLLMSAALTYTIMVLLGPAIGFALNLPAVCGAIVAIGITADSFIVFFERVRDEIREGRSLQPAVARGWPRARRTILVSDFVSFLSAAVLFVVTVGKVQGFAFTLGLTTLLDVVVVFFFTRPLLTILARKKFFASGHPWSGLDPKRLGVKPPLRRSRRTVPADPKEA